MFGRQFQCVRVLALLLVIAAPASACRLPHKLLFEQPSPAHRSLILLSVAAQQTAFDLSDISGFYMQCVPRLEFRGSGDLLVGGELPLIALHRDDRQTTKLGIGNPVLFGQWQLPSGKFGALGLGMQIEIPVGNRYAGLASDHWEFLPHILFAHSTGLVGFATDVGLRLSNGPDHHHADDEHVLLVDPHSDSEFLYRIALSRHRSFFGVTPSAYWNGQIVLDHGSEGDSSANSGLVVELPISASYILVPEVEFPVAGKHRMNWTLRLSAEARI